MAASYSKAGLAYPFPPGRIVDVEQPLEHIQKGLNNILSQMQRTSHADSSWKRGDSTEVALETSQMWTSSMNKQWHLKEQSGPVRCRQGNPSKRRVTAEPVRDTASVAARGVENSSMREALLHRRYDRSLLLCVREVALGGHIPSKGVKDDSALPVLAWRPKHGSKTQFVFSDLAPVFDLPPCHEQTWPGSGWCGDASAHLGALPLPPLESRILRQVEYYFSDKNLVKDFFLRARMDEAGWVSLGVINQFNRMRHFGCELDFVAEVLRGSDVLEVADGDVPKVRLCDPEKRVQFGFVDWYAPNARQGRQDTDQQLIERRGTNEAVPSFQSVDHPNEAAVEAHCSHVLAPTYEGVTRAAEQISHDEPSVSLNAQAAKKRRSRRNKRSGAAWLAVAAPAA